MLFPYNESLLKSEIQGTTAQYLREAQADRILEQLYPRRPSWLAQQIRRALQNLEHVLVALSRRLDARSA